MTRTIIGVSPPEALAVRPRLFSALGDACDVEFVDTNSNSGELRGVLFFGAETTRAAVPTLAMGTGGGGTIDGADVTFSRADVLNEHLRGWVIPDQAIRGASSVAAELGATILADVAGRPVWTTRMRSGMRHDHAALVPEELGRDETLRSSLVPDRYFGLLPLVAFLRSLDRSERWHRPPVLASFIMDDPNLHSMRYGYIDYEDMAREGADIGLHLSVATVPIDGWFWSAGAARTFRAHPDTLSLVMHGNNHTRNELGDGRGERSRRELIAQALRRVRRFEQRSGIPVARVMTPPHGRCSEETAHDMARLGLESLCVTRPFPWLDRPPPQAPLAGWFPADTSTPLPVVERVPIANRPEELPLRAFLGQSLVVYGHHWDLGERPGLLTEWAGHVARLGGVSWASVGDISRSMVSWRHEPETLIVRPHTRVVDVTVPEDVSRLVIEGGADHDALALIESTEGAWSVPLYDGVGEVSLAHASERLTIRMYPHSAIDPDTIRNPRWSPLPIARRLLTEARDRSRPWVDARRDR